MKNLTDFRKTVETGVDPRLVMVNPGTHLVTNHESQSRTIELLLATVLKKIITSPKLKMIVGLYGTLDSKSEDTPKLRVTVH